MTSLLVTPPYSPVSGNNASPTVYPAPGKGLPDNGDVTERDLHQIFFANLTRLMAKTPALNSAPKLEAQAGIGTTTFYRWRDNGSFANLESMATVAKAFDVPAFALLIDPKLTDEQVIALLLRRR